MPEAEVEDRSHVVVVTPDNINAFVESKLNPQAEKPAEPEKEEVKEEPEPKIEDKEAQGLDKKEGKLNKRFSELTEQRKAAEAKADAERARADAAERKAAELEAKLNPPKPKAEDGPKRDQFASDEEYEQARVDYRVDLKFKEEKQKEAEAKQNEQRNKTIKDFKGRQDAFIKDNPDYTAKIEAAVVEVSNEVRDWIIESDFGPQILDHFADHPEEAERFRAMTRDGASKAFGRLEARFEKEQAPQGASKSEKKPVAKVEISKAPAPISPLKGANSVSDLPINSKGEWTGSYQEFKAADLAGKIK